VPPPPTDLAIPKFLVGHGECSEHLPEFELALAANLGEPLVVGECAVEVSFNDVEIVCHDGILWRVGFSGKLFKSPR